MATHHSTTAGPPIRVQPEAILRSGLAPLSSDLDEPLFVRSGNAFHEASDSIVIDRARRLIGARFTTRAPELHSNEGQLHDFLLTQLGARDNEVFALMLLDVQNRLIEYVELFHGSVDGASIYPREVVKWVISTRAFAVMVAHNHPSGDPDPSAADRLVTRRLRDALALIEVRLEDHFIVGRSVTSMRDRGMLP
jgi:DNA repair protein RadC